MDEASRNLEVVKLSTFELNRRMCQAIAKGRLDATDDLPSTSMICSENSFALFLFRLRS